MPVLSNESCVVSIKLLIKTIVNMPQVLPPLLWEFHQQQQAAILSMGFTVEAANVLNTNDIRVCFLGRLIKKVRVSIHYINCLVLLLLYHYKRIYKNSMIYSIHTGSTCLSWRWSLQKICWLMVDKIRMEKCKTQHCIEKR